MKKTYFSPTFKQIIKQLITFCVIVLFLPGNSIMGSLYRDKEIFSEPQLEFLKKLQTENQEDLKKYVEIKKINLNEVFKIPMSADVKKAYSSSFFERIIGDLLTVASSSNDKFWKETLTFTQYFIINDDLNRLKKILDLGADPFTMSNWHGDSFSFASYFEKDLALDLLFKYRTFDQFNDEQKLMLIRNLFHTETDWSFFSKSSYKLKKKIPEVALKNKVDFNFEPHDSIHDFPILDLSPNGIDKVKWLIENNVSINVIDYFGRSLEEQVEYREKNCQSEGDGRNESFWKDYCKTLKEIKALIIAKGGKFPAPTKEENLKKRAALGKKVVKKKIEDR